MTQKIDAYQITCEICGTHWRTDRGTHRSMSNCPKRGCGAKYVRWREEQVSADNLKYRLIAKKILPCQHCGKDVLCSPKTKNTEKVTCERCSQSANPGLDQYMRNHGVDVRGLSSGGQATG